MALKSAYWDWSAFDNILLDDLLLRFATDSDFPFVKSVVCHPSTVQALHHTPESAEDMIRNLWKKGFDASTMRHYIVESKRLTGPVAYLRLLYPFQEPHCLWLSFLVVDPLLRGQGYGRRILELLLKVAKDTRLVNRFGMHTGSTISRAVKLYESTGFQCIHRESWRNEDGTQEERLTFCRAVE